MPINHKLMTTSLVLAVFAGICALLLWVVQQQAEPVLLAHEQEKRLAELNRIIPPHAYDNALSQDWISLSVPTLDAKKPIKIYRARLNNKASAAILQVTAPNGYSGDIQLMVGVWASGQVAGVRVISHKETPGLGDYIEDKRSPWSQQLIGKSLTNPNPERWKVKKDGGVFTYNTGATITPRAVVGMVSKTLQWVEENTTLIYDTPAKESTP